MEKLLMIVVILQIGIVSLIKLEDLHLAIKLSKFSSDISFNPKCIRCIPCNVLIKIETSQHLSNVLRHFNSDSHKFKAQWCMKHEEETSKLTVVSLKQKSTLLSFFGGTSKTKFSPDDDKSTISSKHPSKKQKLADEREEATKTILKEIQLKEKIQEQKTQINVMEVNRICSHLQNEFQAYHRDDGIDKQNIRFQIETMTANVARHFSSTCDLLMNQIETKKDITFRIEKSKKKSVSQIIATIENCDKIANEKNQVIQHFLGDKLNTLSAVIDRQRIIEDFYSSDQLIKSVEKSFLEYQPVEREDYIKFSVLLQKENSLSDFLSDLIQNIDKKRPTWSESTVNLFSLLLNYGGPVAVDLLRKNFGGPSLSSVYLKARQTISIETTLTEKSFKNAAEFYRKTCNGQDMKRVLFTVAIDATPVLPLIRVKGNELLGFSTNTKIIVNTAEDIIQVFKDDSLARAQQTYVFTLVPLRSDIPYYILAAPPVVKGENQDTAKSWLLNAKEWGCENDLNICGLGADGDSKVRSFYINRYIKESNNQNFGIERVDFTMSLPMNDNQWLDCPFPDPRHLLKKWRNQILNIRRLLILGDRLVQLENLMELADKEEFKHTLGLWKTDIRVNDKQNVNAAIRLFHPNVQKHLEYDMDKYTGTSVYLHLGTLMYEMYFKKDLEVNQRIKFAWTLVQFCRLWKTWLVLSKYSTDRTFISDQTYHDVIIAGQSFILMTKFHFLYHKDQPYEPWIWGSNSCEDVFSKSRCFVRTKNNFCYSEFLDICKRIQKVTEMEFNFDKASKFVSYDVSDVDINTIIENEMKNGDKYTEELLQKTNMHILLQKSGVLDVKNQIKLSTWDKELQLFQEKEVDELEELSQDELGSLNDAEIIISTIANDNDLTHSSDLIDMACDQQDTNEIENMNDKGKTLEPLCLTSTKRISQGPQPQIAATSSAQVDIPVNSKNLDLDPQKHTSKKNTHIFYKGNWYHISQFVSWEQGKFYMPKQSRLNRFYANYILIDKFLPSVSDSSHDSQLVLGDFIASWSTRHYFFGKIARIIKQSTKGKCAHPQFIWKKESDTAGINEFAIQTLETYTYPTECSESDSNNDDVPNKLILTKQFKWISCKDFVLKLDLRNEHGIFIMDSVCRKRLLEGMFSYSLY